VQAIGPFALFDIRRLANRLALYAPADKRCGMLSFPKIFEWRTRNWRAVSSLLQPRRRNLTLRELLESLEAYRNRTAVQSPHLQRLISLVKGDVESSGRFPLRRGGPDTPRPLGAWKSRYNHLDRYMRYATAHCHSDAASAQAMSAAEYEGWPLPTPQLSQLHRLILADGTTSIDKQRR